MSENKKIMLRKYYAVSVRLASPLCISSGLDYYTDSDILKNGSANPFIPGTSFAGAFRNYLGIKKNEDCIMGYSEDKDGKMSSLFISDLYFDEGQPDDFAQTVSPTMSVRDRVLLTEEKSVDNKYDMEIIETGAKGVLFLNYLIREGEKQEELESAVSMFLQQLQEGEIRLGANKNRGFGRLEIEAIYERDFTAESVDKWLEFLQSRGEIDRNHLDYYCMDKNKDVSYKAWVNGKKKSTARYIKIQVPLKLTGGISIRRYSARPDRENFEHITCNGEPVIPGSSWSGAIRADARTILKELGCKAPEKILRDWFGDIKKKKQRDGTEEPDEKQGTELPESDEQVHQSKIIIAESRLKNAVRLTMTRTRINRFDASAQNGALYSEGAYFGGKTWLEIFVKKDKEESFLEILGMLNLVIQDIQKGYLAIGGQTAVGRGIFEADKENSVRYSEPIKEDSCLSALYAAIIRGNGR